MLPLLDVGEGSRNPLELWLVHLDADRLAAVFRAVADRVSWSHSPRGSGSGVGIAGSIEKGGRVATAVEVRAEAGRPLQIVRIFTACGEMVNPRNLRNHVEGATVMGLGPASSRRSTWTRARFSYAAFTRYRVRRFADVLPIEVILIDRK